jgi:energy-coupling factor transport system permease protein
MPLFTVVVFAVDKLPLAAGQMLILLCLWIAAALPINKLLSYTKLLLFFVVFIIVLQMVLGPENNAGFLLRPLVPRGVPLIGGMGSLKRAGLFTGLTIACRLVSLMTLMPMFTMTTESRMLALGLTKLGINYRAAYIITTTLNLAPFFEEEAAAIMDARKLRGMNAFETGKLFDRLKEYPALAFPLIINAMRRAQLMGTVMDARGFGAYKTRTWLENISMTAIDYTALAAGIAYAALALFLNFTW